MIILLGFLAFAHFGTPLLADLAFELYHLLKIETIYSIYSALRYASAQYMFWPHRWAVTLCLALIGFGWLWLRSRRRAVQAEPA